MDSFEVRYFGSGQIDQRYCFEMLKWVIIDVRRSHQGFSWPATLEVDKQGVQFTVHDGSVPQPNNSGEAGNPQPSCDSHSMKETLSHSDSEPGKPRHRTASVHKVQTDFARVHRFVKLNAAKSEFCYLVKPTSALTQLNNATAGKAKGDAASNMIMCYVFEAASSADLAAIDEAFSEPHRRMSEPSREGTRVDNIDTLMQVGCSFFEVAYTGRAGITTYIVPLDRIDALIGSVVQRRQQPLSDQLAAVTNANGSRPESEKQPPNASTTGASTMLLEIADSFICLINTVSKCVVLSRDIRNISYVFQGHANQFCHYIGIVSRESRLPTSQPATAAAAAAAASNDSTSAATPNPAPAQAPFCAYILECSEKSVADECMYTLRQAFETTRNKNPDVYKCAECPVGLLNSIAQRVDKLLISHFQLESTQSQTGANGTPATTAELSAPAVQSQLASLVDVLGWWDTFDVHRLSALVQENGGPLLSTQSNTNLTLFASLQTALRSERAQTSLADSILALKSVLDAAQRGHVHVNTSDPVLREGFLTRSASGTPNNLQQQQSPSSNTASKITRSATQSSDLAADTGDDSDASRQPKNVLTGLLGKLRLFGKDGSSHNLSLSPTKHANDADGNASAEARLRSQSAHTAGSNENDAQKASLGKSSLLASVTEEKFRAQSDSVGEQAKPSADGADSKPADSAVSEEQSHTSADTLSQIVGEEQAAPSQTVDNLNLDADRVAGDRQRTLSEDKVRNIGLHIRRSSMPHRAALVLQQAKLLEATARGIDPSSVPSSLRLTIFQRVVNPGFIAANAGASRASEIIENIAVVSDSPKKRDVVDSELSSGTCTVENRTARDRWRRAIWTVIIKKRFDKQQGRHSVSDEDRLLYDDVSLTNTAYADWLAVLTKPNEQRDLAELRRLVIAGVPKELRGRIWLYLIDQQKKRRDFSDQSFEAADTDLEVANGNGNRVPRSKTQNRKMSRLQSRKQAKDSQNEVATKFDESVATYELLLGRLTCRDVQRAIMLDLGRTFPQYPYFSSGQGVGQLSLFNLLKAYSLLDPDVGYCQGLGFIVGVLLLHLSEHEAFYALCYFMSDMNFREQYLPDMLGLQIQQYQLEHLLLDEDPVLHNHLAQHGVAPSLYASSWFLTLFAANFPIGVVARIFDFLFCDGSIEILLRTALLLLTEHSELLTSFHSLETIVDCFKSTLPKIAPLQIERIIAKLYDRSYAARIRDYELEFCVTKETQNEMQSRVTELENEVDRLRRLLHRADRLLPTDKNDAVALRSQIRQVLSRPIIW